MRFFGNKTTQFFSGQSDWPADSSRKVRLAGMPATAGSLPPMETVKYWVRKFKSGFRSIHDSPREGRPNFVVPKDSVCQVKTLVLEDGRVTVKQLAAITKMSVGSIETILHDHLHMSKISARWVSRLMTPNQKEQRADSCKELIELESKDTQFFYRIVTMDET